MGLSEKDLRLLNTLNEEAKKGKLIAEALELTKVPSSNPEKWETTKGEQPAWAILSMVEEIVKPNTEK